MFEKVKEKLRCISEKVKPIVMPWLSKAWDFIKTHKIISSIVAAILVIAIIIMIVAGRGKGKLEKAQAEYEVQRMTVSDSISASTTIEANDEYSVTPLVTGEILEANFEEGDVVEKDQVLYVVDSSSVENSLKTMELSVEKAQDQYNKALNSHTDTISSNNQESNRISLQKAQNTYNQAQDSVNDLTVSAEFTGTVGEVYVSVGDSVANGTRIAEVVDNSTMKARIPFNESDASNIWSGQSAELTLVNTGTVLYGTVTAVSSGSETVSGGVKVSYVVVEVSNPGAILPGDKVTAMINGMACNDVGEFEAVQSRTVLSKVNGTVSGVWVIEGDYLVSGSTIATIDSDSVDNSMRDADLALREAQLKKATSELEQMDADDYAAKLKSARIALDEALLNQDKLYEQLEDYTITSPISGTIVTKNKKAGEKIENGNTSSTSTNVLAVIYDMSSLCATINVDELEIMKVSVGQEAVISVDAVEGKTYTGVVENVSVNGTIGTNGVTTYPVKVRISDADDQLLPGMNIDIYIVVEEAENVIAVPSNAVNRGNTVYVKGNKESDDDMAPDGFKTVEVETGISNDSFVEITSGLNEGDIVYVVQSSSGETGMMMPEMGGGMPGGMGGGMGGGMPSGGGGMPSGGGGGMPGGGR